MSSVEKIKRLFAKSDVTVNSKVDDSIINDALTAFDKSEKTKPVSAESNIWRLIMRSRITKLTAAAVIIIIAVIFFSANDQKTLYAQVIKAIEDAHTIHAVGHNGRGEKVTEIWYDQSKGIVKTAWRNGEKTFIQIDNGQYVWTYRSVKNSAVRKKSRNATGLPREILDPERYLKECERDSTGDTVIDGFQCDMYVTSYPDRANSTRLMFWVDAQKRLRRFEEKVLRDGQWQTIEIQKIEYDIEVDPDIFVPDFGPDVKIVDSEG